MTKPFDQRELFARVRALLRRPRTITTDVLKAASLVLNTGSHELSLDGKAIKLISVYSCMNRLRNKLRSKGIDDLIQTVHGSGYKFVQPVN